MSLEPDPRIPIDQAALLFGLLADKTRLRLLLRLAEGADLSVAALAEAFGMSQPALGHHLQQLRLARVVARRREGPNVFYSLNPGPARNLLRYVLP
jgi:DNA-binding transcriptional ArsR family regulator